MGIRIHPSAVLGPQVELGMSVVIGPQAVLLGQVRVGDDCWIGACATLGAPPEIRGYAHGADWEQPVEGPGVVLGARTVLREHVTVHSGSHRATTIGDDCFVMNRVYLAHDGLLEDGVTVAGGVSMGGHVSVGAGANLGMGAVVHQRRVVGPGAMVGMGAVVTRDVPPFAKAYGNPARAVGANVVGLQRMGLPAQLTQQLDEAYRIGPLPEAEPVVLPDHPTMREAMAWWEGRHA